MLLREYETIYILRPDMPDEGTSQLQERLTGILDREGAQLLRHDVWGKKKLAYELKKHPKGVYVYLQYLGKPGVSQELERNLRLLEPVLAFQTVKIADNVDATLRMAEKEKEDKARAAAQAQRQEAAETEEKAEVKSALQLDPDKDSQESFGDNPEDPLEADTQEETQSLEE